MNAHLWGDKPYHSLDWELKSQFGQKIYKLSLDAGCTCPTRDGTKGYGGCTFCSAGGSGDFTERRGDAANELVEKTVDSGALSNRIALQIASGEAQVLPVAEQLARAKQRVMAKMPRKTGSPEPRFIAYYQSFTNTYGDLDNLRAQFTAAITQPDIVGLSIGTRPDCLPPEAVAILAELNQKKPVWVELGLQTVHEKTAERINRCYELPVFEDAYRRLKEAGLRVVVHIILGLPGETKADMEATVRYLAGLPTLNARHFESLSVPGKTSLSAPGEANPCNALLISTLAGLQSTADDPVPLLTPPDGIKLQLMHVLRGTRLAEQVAAGEADLYQWTMEDYVDFVIDMVELLPPDMTVHRLTGDGAKRDLISPLWSGDKKRVLNTFTRRFRERETWQGRKR